jgi:hypothetical protein
MNDGSGTPHAIEKSATEARQAVTTGRVRWILAISLLLAIAALAISYWLTLGHG